MNPQSIVTCARARARCPYRFEVVCIRCVTGNRREECATIEATSCFAQPAGCQQETRTHDRFPGLQNLRSQSRMFRAAAHTPLPHLPNRLSSNRICAAHLYHARTAHKMPRSNPVHPIVQKLYSHPRPFQRHTFPLRRLPCLPQFPTLAHNSCNMAASIPAIPNTLPAHT